MISLTRRALIPSLFSAVAPATAVPDLLRIGIAESLVRDVSITDARAAMVVWMKRIVQDLSIELRYPPEVFEPDDRLAAKLRLGELDTVAVNVISYRRLVDWLDPGPVTIPAQKTRLEYVLLVRADSGIDKLASLRGRRLMLLDTPPACIAPAWLSNLIAAEATDSPTPFFSAVIRRNKPNQVILPVFFGQADACLTTHPSFLTMSELNPQIATRLRPLAVSPEIVSSLYAFRRGWQGPARDKVVRALADLHLSTSGRQVLNLFQCESLVVRHSSCLKSSLEIMAQAERHPRANFGSSK